MWVLVAVLFAASMVIYPREVFQASVRGLDTWWHIVFPALLPFFVVSELLINFGVVEIIGVLLEPLMRPIFNVPGAGAFVVAMGYTSGFPIGSLLTVKLRKKRLCTRCEAERLMSFTNNASPLFMFGAVAVGMFSNPSLGIIIAGSHYLANLTVGLMLRFWGIRDKEKVFSPPTQGNLLTQTFYALKKVRQQPKSLGKLLGEAIKNSVETLILIGGFIILFSAFLEVLALYGVIDWISKFLLLLLNPIEFNHELTDALANGLWEVTLGSKMASEANAPLTLKVMAVTMILGWSGLSVHAQVASIISETDLRMLPFVISRLLQATLSAIYVNLFLGPAQPVISYLNLSHPAFPATWYGMWLHQFQQSAFLLLKSFIILGTLSLILLIPSILKNTRIIIWLPLKNLSLRRK